jgi:hypothetical protein
LEDTLEHHSELDSKKEEQFTRDSRDEGEKPEYSEDGCAQLDGQQPDALHVCNSHL